MMSFYRQLTYSPDLPSRFRSLFSEVKILHLTDVPEDLDLSEWYARLARSLGLLVKQEENPVSGAIRKNWTEISYVEELSNDTYKHSNKAQPLHTDYCYFPVVMDVTFLFCEEQAEEGGATIFVDADVVVSELEKHRPGLLQELKTRRVILGRGKSPFTTRRAHIIDEDSRGLLLNWNYFRVSEANQAEVLGIREQFHEFLQTRIVDQNLCLPIRLQPGEAVFVRDNRVLHGREAFIGNRRLLKGAIITDWREQVKMQVGLGVRSLVKPFAKVG